MTQTPPTPPPASRTRQILEWVLVAVFAILLALPLFQQVTGMPEDIRLAGVEAREPDPVFSWASWFDGRYAASVDKWLTGKIGLRGLLVNLACQVNYSVFGRIGMNGGTEVVEGRDHWLYERAYIKWAVRQPPMGEKKAVQFAEQAARLQQALARRGIAFALVIAPSKAQIVPERLPPEIPLPARNATDAYSRIMPELEKRNVRVLDGHRLFLELKAKEKFLFPPTGIHWSYQSAWLTWQNLADLLRTNAACSELPLQPVEKIVWHTPLGADSDLRMLLNLWHFEPNGPPLLPYPLVAPPPDALRDRFAALVVGDSFSLALIDGMARSGVFRQIDLLYYFKRRYTYPSPSFAQSSARLIADAGIDMGPLDKANMGWDDLLQNRQMVILTLNEIHIKDCGWGFLEALLAELEPDQRATMTVTSPATRQ
jgi:hypothetical protein